MLEKLPFFALSALVSGITLFFQSRFLTSLEGVTPVQRGANAVVAIATYLRKFLYPSALAPLYPHPNLPTQGGVPLDEGTVLVSALLLVTITLAVLRARQPPYLIGWLWFLGLLVPTLGFVQVGRQALADRYTYLPSIGLAVALVWGVAELAARLRTPAARRLFCAAAAVVLAGYGVAAYFQTRIWRDSESMLRHTLAVSPRASAMRFNLGRWLYLDQRPDEAIEQSPGRARGRPGQRPDALRSRARAAGDGKNRGGDRRVPARRNARARATHASGTSSDSPTSERDAWPKPSSPTAARSSWSPRTTGRASGSPKLSRDRTDARPAAEPSGARRSPLEERQEEAVGAVASRRQQDGALRRLGALPLEHPAPGFARAESARSSGSAASNQRHCSWVSRGSQVQTA